MKIFFGMGKVTKNVYNLWKIMVILSLQIELYIFYKNDCSYIIFKYFQLWVKWSESYIQVYLYIKCLIVIF